MPKSQKASKVEKKDTTGEKSAKNIALQAELMDSVLVDSVPLRDDQSTPLKKNKRTRSDSKTSQEIILTPEDLSLKSTSKSASDKQKNASKQDTLDDEETFKDHAEYSTDQAEDSGVELLESEDFDIDSSDDLLAPDATEMGDMNDLEDMSDIAELDNDYFDDISLSEFNAPPEKTYALGSYPRGKDLPVPAKKHLPSPMSQDNLQLYIREISKFPLLTPEEEVELSRKVRDEGDSDAAFRIISSHLRLVVKVAMSFQRRWMQNVLDLIQEGNVGLMRAINKFDPDKGIKFSYYATFWIKAYILKFIMDNWRMVKIGTTQAQRKLFYNLNKERQRLVSQGFDPDATALSEALGVSVDQVVEMQQRLSTSDMSLDTPVNDEHGSASKVDFFPALGPGIEDSYAESEIASLVQDRIASLLPELSEKETFILQNRLLTDDPVTLREIGEKYDVTRERIRQLEARLLIKLRNHLGNEIKDFSESWIQN